MEQQDSRNIEAKVSVSAQPVHWLDKEQLSQGMSYMLGKWVIVAYLFGKWWPNGCSSICVVDDFGNLVAVEV